MSEETVTLEMAGNRGKMYIAKSDFVGVQDGTEYGGVKYSPEGGRPAEFGLPSEPPKPVCLVRFGSPGGQTVFVHGTKEGIAAKFGVKLSDLATALDDDRVNEIFDDCLPREDEVDHCFIFTLGIREIGDTCFYPSRLLGYRGEVAAMLADLPDEFKSADAWQESSLDACRDRRGVPWTSIPWCADELFVLCKALNLIKHPM